MIPLLVSSLAVVIGGALGWGVPRLIAWVPEPAPEPVDPDRPPPPPKELYRDIARLPGLQWRSAAVGAVLAGLFAWRLVTDGRAAHLLQVLPLLGLGIALAVIDWRTKRLPKRLIAPAYPVLIVLVLLAAPFAGGWVDVRRAALGWVVMGGFYALTWLLSPRLVGYGDVRLAGLLGIGLGALGWGELVVGMYSAFLVNAIPALLLLAWTRDRSVLKRRYPFGPAMLVGAAFGVLVGGALWGPYLDVAGFG